MEKIKAFFAKNEIAKLSVILCVITSVTALLLGTVNGVTAPIIERLETAATVEAMQQIVTTADDFTSLEIPADSNSLVTEFYQGTAGGETVGYCVKVTPSGYGGDITIVVGFDADGTVVGTSVVDHAETPGLGSKIVDQPSFAEQFIGKSTSLVITKTGATAANEIDAISGATISSTAMTLGVSTAIDFVAANK
ncbi:MAG: RnfABCDGE type electron transport complex subunit G [Clostridia bacterium]